MAEKELLEQLYKKTFAFSEEHYDTSGTLRDSYTDFVEYSDVLSVLKQHQAELRKHIEDYEKKISGLEETIKILQDDDLREKIRKARKKGSKSSPYKPLVALQKKGDNTK